MRSSSVQDLTLKVISNLRVPSYRHVAELVCGGRLRECYEVVDRLIKAGLVRQIDNPYDRRQRCLALTQNGARALSLPPVQAKITARVLKESVREADVYMAFVRAGLPAGRILLRHEVLSRFSMKPRRSAVSLGVVDGEGVHFVYVRHPWSTLSALVESVTCAPAQVLSHIVVCMAESTFRRNLKLLLSSDKKPEARVVSVKEIPALVRALSQPVFGEMVSEVMPRVASGGRPWLPPEKEPFAIGWEHPRYGAMRLVDARFGDLAAFRQLNYSSERGLPATVFVGCREQAERIAKIYRYHEALWVLVCDSPPEEGLFRVHLDGLLPVNGGDKT